MAITYPLDILADFPGWTTEFDLMWRQEQSRTANGRTIVKDLGSPLWRASYVSRSLSPNLLDHWRARLTALENGLQTFLGYPLSRCRPILHPGSSSLPTGELHTVDANMKAIRVSGLTGISLSVGDFVSIEGDLHQVMEGAVAVAGLTPLFEVRPHIWPGVEAGDSPPNEVSITRPHCIMAIVPGSLSSSADMSTGRGSVSFQAMEAR